MRGPRDEVTNPSAQTAAAPPGRAALSLPLAFIALLGATAALPMARANPRLSWAFAGVALALFIWNAALFVRWRRGGPQPVLHRVIRRPHWVQPLAQLAVYVYWGYHWRVVYQSAWMIAGQVVFAYAFDMLLAWSLGEEYELGFGPFPIVLSINLFMWFKPDWFVWQFVIVASGFAAKRLIRWTKDGRRAHIFNPSSLPLSLVSIALILTQSTNLTWGQDIARTLTPDHIYEYLFLIGLPGQLMFGVTWMTMPAVLTAFLLSHAYYLGTGVWYFVGPIPSAALLGMTLLFTDPSTAPRSELGRVLYGVLYGLSVFALYGLLGLVGVPTFYDKLLFVPFLNLGVRAIDRFAARPWLSWLDTARIAPGLTGIRRNAAMISVWALVFAAIYSLHGVGMHHPGLRLNTWIDACQKGLRNGCANLDVAEKDVCANGSAWVCNENGIRDLQPGGKALPEGLRQLERACGLGSEAGCANLWLASSGAPLAQLRHGRPGPRDWALLVDNRNLRPPRDEREQLQRACEQGWSQACEDLRASPAEAAAPGQIDAESLRARCAAGDVASCRALGMRFNTGDGVPRDPRRALACELGIADTCARPWLDAPGASAAATPP